jgi:uncharacterized protein YjbJ (UPF0337 family)
VNYQIFRSGSIALILTIAVVCCRIPAAVAMPLDVSPNIHLLATDTFKGSLQKFEGKLKETVGNLQGDREAQVQGKVKQAEGTIRSSDLTNPDEAEIATKTKQAEASIRQYQTSDRQADNIKDALQ